MAFSTYKNIRLLDADIARVKKAIKYVPHASTFTAVARQLIASGLEYELQKHELIQRAAREQMQAS